MTIYLPEDLRDFRQAFDEACERIMKSEQDSIFYHLFLLLATKLREHPLLKDFIFELESKGQKNQQDFNEAVQKVLEDSWKNLWEYYPLLQQRRNLVRIKQMITDSEKRVSAIPYGEVRLKKDDQGSPYLWIDPALGNISRERNPKMHDRQIQWLLENGDNEDDPRRKSAFDLFSDPSCQQSSSIYRRGLSSISRFCSSENVKLDAFIADTSLVDRFLIPGRNENEKRKNMLFLMELYKLFGVVSAGILFFLVFSNIDKRKS